MNELSAPKQQAVGSHEIQNFAQGLAKNLERQFKEIYKPGGSKTLRKFNSRDVVELTGISASNLRLRLAEPDFPQPEIDGRGHHWYTAEKIDQIRDHMFRTGAKNAQAYKPGRRPGDKLQVISVVNFKGGCAKTTSVIHLAQRYALRGYRVLAVDMDPQASLTTMFGYRPEIEFTDSGTIYDALRYQDPLPLRDVIKKTYFHNLDLAPSGLMLSEYETETALNLRRNTGETFATRLIKALEPVDQDYDIVLIDCPPQLGFTTLTAICCSTSMIVTVIPSMLDVASMSQFLRQLGELIQTLEEMLKVSQSWDFFRFLLTRYEPSDAPQTQMASYLRMNLRENVLVEPMLKSTAISDSGLSQQTVLEVEPSGFTKKTLERAISSVVAVADEIEGHIQQAWGR